MHPGHSPICEAGISSVPSYETMAAKPVYEPVIQRGNHLFPNVCCTNFRAAQFKVTARDNSTLAFCLVNLQDRLLLSFGVQWLHPVVVAASSILVLTLTPRFILSIRALYARDVRGRQGYGIDTGFGFSSLDAGGGSAMVFADIRENEDSQQVEEIPMAGGIRSTQGDIAMC